ncbi:hypothetical protein VZT92_022272 [Zoarces viviparus]|uniref:Uncharacterized protein n=1 Tax=Zoarces viviparus TaxID=48416 RepID=A0AAW1EBK4_ZOAVI
MEQFVPAGRSLSVCRRLCYAAGPFKRPVRRHVVRLHLLVYRHSVISFPSTDAMMLIGQIADGVFTPLVGYGSDRTVCVYGKRKAWMSAKHDVQYIMFTDSGCLGYQHVSDETRGSNKHTCWCFISEG